MKSSFLLHLDSLCILDEMTDDQAGKLFKAIRHYQQHGELPEMDLLMKFAITPFVNQFVRDKEKYDKVAEKNRENGQKGGRPKATEPVDSEPKEPSGFSGNPNNPVAPDSDSVSDSVKENEKGSKKKEFEVFDFGDKALNESWADWVAYRKEKKNPVTETAAKKQITFLKKFPFSVGVEIIDRSIQNGWKGLFELPDKATVRELYPNVPATGTDGRRNANSYI